MTLDRWTDKQVRVLRSMAADGQTPDQDIADAVNKVGPYRTVTAVAYKRIALGCRFEGRPGRRLSSLAAEAGIDTSRDAKYVRLLWQGQLDLLQNSRAA